MHPNKHFLSWLINGLSDGIDMANSNPNDGRDVLTNTHSDGSNEETTTTHTVDELDTIVIWFWLNQGWFWKKKS